MVQEGGQVLCIRQATGQESRYQLKEKLGQNASRQTWLAVDLGTQSQEQVVVKLLALSPQMQWDEHKLFEREAQVLKNLDHPRIPKYRDDFVLEQQAGSRFPWFGLVQSYVPGTSFQQLLDQGYRFSESQIEKIATEILSILVYLHELDPPVLHRDIKPSNLIWGEDERVYLVDFGAVQDQAVLEGATFTVVGTYGYVPMEQFAGRAVPASDLYAVGATLIHLLTGTSPADLPYRDSRIQFADRVSVDLGFVHWIGKLTEPNVTERLSTARQALDALKNRHALTPPLTSRKPTGSRIQIKKSAEKLEINIPKRGKKAFKLFYVIGLIIPFIWHLPQWMSLGTAGPYIMLILILLFVLFQAMVLPAFRHTDLYFDREHFDIRWKLFGNCYWRFRGKTPLISRVYEEIVQRGSAPRGVTIEYVAKYYSDKRTFTSSPLATVERHWLISEIQDWLGVK
ncbi:serine/threonine-protein kinase [Brasilonema sp. UFV-L1]|uniref:serine/threonine protein kinase n=1 Tax=Brasilonema sp. UFV-L1 TaxID=2234130 RepID=UPI00145D9EF9|nr:serine/threonine-protein kinase [Brasilonema sp. UFV-L1]NMG11585.1 serine/threonine protein kinase [Brasilonema sp. UFV-L1]